MQIVSCHEQLFLSNQVFSGEHGSTRKRGNNEEEQGSAPGDSQRAPKASTSTQDVCVNNLKPTSGTLRFLWKTLVLFLSVKLQLVQLAWRSV